MFNRKELKSKAKLVLSRSYLMTFLACLAVNLIGSGRLGLSPQSLKSLNPETMSSLKIVLASGIIGILGIIAVLFFILLATPLLVGLKKFMLNTSKGSSSLEDLLFPFKSNYKNITLTMFIKKSIHFPVVAACSNCCGCGCLYLRPSDSNSAVGR